MANSQTYVVKVTQYAMYSALAEIEADSPLDAAGKAFQMVDHGDPNFAIDTEKR